MRTHTHTHLPTSDHESIKNPFACSLNLAAAAAASGPFATLLFVL